MYPFVVLISVPSEVQCLPLSLSRQTKENTLGTPLFEGYTILWNVNMSNRIRTFFVSIKFDHATAMVFQLDFHCRQVTILVFWLDFHISFVIPYPAIAKTFALFNLIHFVTCCSSSMTSVSCTPCPVNISTYASSTIMSDCLRATS